MTICRIPGLRVASSSARRTRELAARIQPLLVPGDVILLGGELGAGKTTFTQGLARAMGVLESVTSPTFTLIRSYDAATPARLLHADVYRLEHLQEVLDLGLPELLDDGAVAVIEWGDVAAPVLRPDYLEIRFDFGSGDDERFLALSAAGPRWAARLPALRRLLSATGGSAGAIP
ncbi:MAG: tRNA (adenosine(37)-N6)-threonylcarbamoyltransferase complex ATPase subunit type 1 TsaE [Actinomycetota bacterium]|nr:tRNA (adenosine(37)-N6)-threonylcarbamoyltransferase complex ATPase subunit type 1 TsaE [Actinomycetota bacterium]